MPFPRWRKGDENIEDNNKTYEDWTTDWWQWSHSMPDDADPINHPLRCDGSKAHIGQPNRAVGFRPVWFCGGYWETCESDIYRSFALPNGKKDSSLLFAVIISGIAEDEFQPPILAAESNSS